MTAFALELPPHISYQLPEAISWYDSDTECTVTLTQPTLDPDLWKDYLLGAQRSYRKHGVECALDFDVMRDGHDTALFYAAVDGDGQVVAGVRAKGPYQSAAESHAIVEWDGQIGEHAVRKMITDRISFGVVEMKTAWATDDPGRSRSLTRTLARTAFPTMALLGAQFVMATAGAHVLDRWRSSGGVVASKIPPTPYPNDHYRTNIMWWDRRTFAEHAEPKQLAKIIEEMNNLAALSQDFFDSGILYGGGA